MLRQTHRLSVAVPVYNGARYLASTLDALIEQTYGDFEIVVSDNGSTDATEEIGREYADRDARIRYVRHAENRGLAWNFNEAFRLTSGEYFKWAAHDDICAPTFLERAVATLDRNPHVVLACAKTAMIDENGERIGAVDDAPRGGSRQFNAPAPHHRYRDVLMNCVYGVEFYGVVRRTVLCQTGLLRRYCLAEKVLIAELALRGEFHQIPDELMSWRSHEGQYTRVASVGEREQISDSRSRRAFSLPYRVQPMLGYLQIIRKSRVGIREGVLCLAVLGRYVLQVRKWRRVIRDAFTGTTVWRAPAVVGPAQETATVAGNVPSSSVAGATVSQLEA